MSTASSIGSTVVNGINTYGVNCRFKYYTGSISDSSYDDRVTLTASGTDTYVSGLFQPLDMERGSADAISIEQGKVLQTDSKLYVIGETDTSGTTIKISVGSPASVGTEYHIIENGVIAWDVNNTPVYKKIYIRQLTNGSFIGEM